MSEPVGITQYRVTWLRKDLAVRHRNCGNSRAKAERCKAFVEGRFQDAYPERKPDAYWCCNGYQCNCGGLTVAEKWQEFAAWTDRDGEVRAPLVFVRIETRKVERWSPEQPDSEGATE
jgi:hypothetical protein